MDALLEELCARYGWCLPPEERQALLASRARNRAEVADAIIRAEYGEPAVKDADKRAFLLPIVDDWLFDASGRGARSGLPP
jgi:hypothetical protein